MAKPQSTCIYIKRIFNFVLLNIKFISRVKQNSVIFSQVHSTSEDVTEFCLTSEINLIFNKNNIEFSVYYIFHSSL